MLECEGSIVELKFLKRGAKILIIFCLYRINTSKDHWLHFLESLNSLCGRIDERSNGIADLNLNSILYACHYITHIACSQFLLRHHVHLQRTYFFCQILLFSVDEAYFLARMHHAIDNLEVSDYATVRVEHGVENKCL